jgi:WD40 repeat protein
MTVLRHSFFTLLACLASIQTSRAADAEKTALAQKAQTILKANCYRCHGEEGAVEGGFNYILDSSRLISRKKIIPGKGEDSPIFKRIVNGTMPPQEVKQRPTEEDKVVLKKWIDAGAPGLETEKPRVILSSANVEDLILSDLEKMDRRARRFVRYITLHQLGNAGLAEDELQTYRNALSKLINSLSWHPKIRVPEPIDAQKTIFRIDLRWYLWDATIWNRILTDYPYAILDDSATARAIMVSTATKVPIIRGDWFVATASRPQLYQDILQLPANLAELERQLRVDASLNITQERVMRVSFNGSGISRNNRILERHDAIHGYYWRTYDFEEVPQNLIERGLLAPDRRNAFAYPLGPGNLENNFLHAGGEAIFSLPNGLQGYYIMNAVNNRLDKAPTAIVSDPKRPDRAVELGVSCMGCHVPGIISKPDQMHEHLDKNPKAFAKTDRELALSLYPAKEKSIAQMDEDSKKFRDALTQTGVKLTRTEPIVTMTLKYESDIDAVTAAAEVGLKLEEFQKKIAETESLSRNLGALRVAGGTVARQVWVQAFGDVVRDLKLGVLFQNNQIGASLPDNTGELDPLEVSAGQSNHMVFSADGRKAIIASADRSVRNFEVEGKRDLKRWIGHTTSVWCVALSNNGERALSGGMDGSIRLWDVASGQQLLKFDGHSSLVSAVAFTPDGKKAVSGGYDGAVVVWDLVSGKETKRWEGSFKYVNALCVAPNGKDVLVCADTLLRLWDMEAANEIRKFEGHTGPVTSVVFSVDGKKILSGSDDRTARLWETDTAKSLQTFNGHENGVRAVALNEKGNWALTGSSDSTVRLWQTATGKELGKFTKHVEPVVQVAFLNNGKQTLSGSRDNALLLWNIEKFYPAPAVDPKKEYPVKEPPTINVSGAISVDGTIGKLILSPNKKWLFYLDRSNNKIGQIDAPNFKSPTETRKLSGLESMTITHDGKWLYAIGRGEAGAGTIFAIDPITLKVRTIPDVLESFDPYEIAASNEGRIYLSQAKRGQDLPLRIWDFAKETEVPTDVHLPPNSVMAISAKQDRLFASEPGALRGIMQVFLLPGKSGAPLPKRKEAPSTPELPTIGDLIATPDGRFLLNTEGNVLWLDPTWGEPKKEPAPKDAKRDLGIVAKIAPFTCAAVDPESGIAFIVTPAGWLKQYAYPQWQEIGKWKVPAIVSHMQLDGKAGRLYMSVIDAQTVRARPHAKGFGDIWLIDMKNLPK